MNLPKPETRTEGAHVPRAYLNPGQLKGRVRVAIDNAPIEPDAEPGPFARAGDGNFSASVEIPVTISGQPVRVKVSVKSPDYLKLCQVFGGDGPSWPGKTVEIFEDANFRRIRVEPIA